MHNAWMGKGLETKADRLKWARETCGIDAIADNASEAARTMGLPEQTYLAHENGSRNFNDKKAIRYARLPGQCYVAAVWHRSRKAGRRLVNYFHDTATHPPII